MKIFNLGSLNIDHVYAVSHFVRPGETLSADRLQIFLGGKGLNQSVALARAGARPIHGGLIGSDGAFLRTVLADAGVDTAFVRTVDVPTGHAVIQVDESGQNCILLFAGANRAWSEAFVCEVLHDAQPGDLLLLQNEIDALPVIFAVAKEKGLSIAFNPSPFDKRLSALPLELVTWWLVNEPECAALTGEHDPQRMADALIARYPHSRLVLTLGGDGCLYRDSEKAVRQPAFLKHIHRFHSHFRIHLRMAHGMIDAQGAFQQNRSRQKQNRQSAQDGVLLRAQAGRQRRQAHGQHGNPVAIKIHAGNQHERGQRQQRAKKRRPHHPPRIFAHLGIFQPADRQQNRTCHGEQHQRVAYAVQAQHLDALLKAERRQQAV